VLQVFAFVVHLWRDEAIVTRLPTLNDLGFAALRFGVEIGAVNYQSSAGNSATGCHKQVPAGQGSSASVGQNSRSCGISKNLLPQKCRSSTFASQGNAFAEQCKPL
jgi:hypothetical protein